MKRYNKRRTCMAQTENLIEGKRSDYTRRTQKRFNQNGKRREQQRGEERRREIREIHRIEEKNR